MRRVDWLRIATYICLFSLLAVVPALAAAGPARGRAQSPTEGTAEAPVAQKAQELRLDGDGPWVVRVLTVDPEALRQLAQWADVWSVHKTKGYTLVQVNRADADRLLAEGLEVKLDRKRTTLLQRELARSRAADQGGLPPTGQPGLVERNQTTGIPGYPCYRTVEETFATAEAIAAAHPNLATWTDVGDSWEKTQSPTAGWDLKVLRLTNAAVPGPKPILFLNCAIHAREYTTAELCTRFAERLAVSAVFLHVIDPVTAPTLQGTVRDVDSLAPLAATVRAGDFETTTDGNGLYSMRLPAGTYDVTVVATGYQSATAEGVVAVDSQTTTQDFDLPPFAGLWTDNAEAGNPGWTAGSPWAITTERAFSPTHAWSDSPGTLYADNANVSLTSPVLDLQGYAGTTLSFRQRYELEQGYDFGRVEISTDGGTNWTEVAVYTGEPGDSWALAEIPLPALDGHAQARVRFRLESDDSVREDGWFLDDVLLRSVFGGNNVPAVTITAPPDGAAFEVGESVTFTGSASDVDDGDLSGAIAWSSSIDGALGTGASLETSTLSEVRHTITAQVTDSGGASGSAEIAVRVGGCAVEVDFDDGSAAGWTNDPASTCTTGSFVVATPTQVSDSGVITQVGGDHTSGTGNAFFSAVNTAAGTDDADGGVCIVESPVYPVTRASDLSIWYFHGQRDAGGDSSGDYFVLELSTDGGSNWTPLASYGDQTVNAAWTEATASLPAGSDVQLRVRISDGPTSGDLVEGGVDDVVICPVEAECTTDPECDDGLYCNGTETCNAGTCQAGADPCPGQSCDEEGDTCIAAPTAQLEWGTVSVGATAVTVPLAKVYISPVVVTAVQYRDNTVPVVTRIANVTPTSFTVRLQNPAGGAVVADTVSYLVVEEGVWTVDGVKIEAWTYTSTVTDENNSWVGQAQSYGQSYTSPVILGQVMSTNDTGWSVFWDRGGSRLNPPTASDLGTGKHVGEDPDVTRVDETVGVVDFETGHGTLGGVEVEAALGPDSVRGVDNSPPYPYTFATPFAAAPTVALVSQAAMDDTNGGWAQVHGATMATTTTLNLSIDEDQIGGSERKHSTEQVGYVVFAAPGVIP